MKNKLDNKFSHATWYKNQGLTKRQAIEKMQKCLDMYLIEKPSLKQSDNMLDDINYDKFVTDGRSSYRLKDFELEYYNSL